MSSRSPLKTVIHWPGARLSQPAFDQSPPSGQLGVYHMIATDTPAEYLLQKVRDIGKLLTQKACVLSWVAEPRSSHAPAPRSKALTAVRWGRGRRRHSFSPGRTCRNPPERQTDLLDP